MKIAVIGAGYVGLVTSACLAELGNQVVGIDSDHDRVKRLQTGCVPIFEPGLDDLVLRNMQAGRLRFSTTLPPAVADAEIIFIAVGTPPLEDGSADLQHVLGVAQQIGMHIRGFKVIVNKSTVPVGTASLVEQAIRRNTEAQRKNASDFAVVSNPEFLKEGAAVEDFMRPDRIVIGVQNTPAGERARGIMARLYAPFNRHRDRTIWMDPASAELTKYAANAMLATRISFMNEMANLADRLGADIDAVRRGIGSDQRIGHSFLYAGTGYGGSCFPKDTRALIRTAADYGLHMQVVEATEQVNTAQKTNLVRRVVEHFGDDLRGVRCAIWGLAFKPNTNDMREAPSRTIICELLGRGAEVVAYDPVAMAEARSALASDIGCSLNDVQALRFVETPLDALDDADALLVVTEWKCFQNPDFQAVARRMRQGIVFDGRNLYDPAVMLEHGLCYQGIGRRNELSSASMQNGKNTASNSRYTSPVPTTSNVRNMRLAASR